jgi:phosphoglycolate phosphatase-like HAD superfamily hydrolase
MKTYIFDFDGVIGDTFDVYADFLAGFMHVSNDKARQYVYEHSFNNNKYSIIKKLIKNFYMLRFESYIKKTNPSIFAGVIEEISKLKGEKYIISRNHSRVCQDILKENQGIFRNIYGFNNSRSKVNAIGDIIRKTRIKKENIVFVSDTIGDYLEVSEVLDNNQIFLVTWGFNSIDDITKFNSHIQTIQEPSNFFVLN